MPRTEPKISKAAITLRIKNAFNVGGFFRMDKQIKNRKNRQRFYNDYIEHIEEIPRPTGTGRSVEKAQKNYDKNYMVHFINKILGTTDANRLRNTFDIPPPPPSPSDEELPISDEEPQDPQRPALPPRPQREQKLLPPRPLPTITKRSQKPPLPPRPPREQKLLPPRPLPTSARRPRKPPLPQRPALPPRPHERDPAGLDDGVGIWPKKRNPATDLFEQGVVNNLDDVKITDIKGKEWEGLDKDGDGLFNTSSIPNPKSMEEEISQFVNTPLHIEEDEEKEMEDALPLTPQRGIDVQGIPGLGPVAPQQGLNIQGIPGLGPVAPQRGINVQGIPGLGPVAPQQGLNIRGIPGITAAAHLIDPQTGRRLEQIGGPVDPPEESRSFIPTAVGALAAGGMAAVAGAGPLGIAAAGGLALLNDQLARQNGWNDWNSAMSILGNEDVLRITQQHLPGEYVRLANSTMRIATDENPASAAISLLINGYEVVHRLMTESLLPQDIDVSNLFAVTEAFDRSAIELKTVGEIGAKELKTVGEIGAKELMRGIGKEVGNAVVRSFRTSRMDLSGGASKTVDPGTASVGSQKLPSMDTSKITWNRDFGPWSTLLKDAQTDFENNPFENPPRPEEILYGHGQLRPDKKYLGSRSMDNIVLMPSKTIARSRNYSMFPESSPYDIEPIPLYERVSMDSIQRQQDFKALVRPCKVKMLVGLS